MKRILAAVLGLTALLALATPTRTTAATPRQRQLDIFFIDVEGGAATLIVTPFGESVLIDSGWPGFGGRDADRIVRVARDVAGLKRIDHLITTHWHTDHYGGVEELKKRFRIRRYWDRGIPETLADDPEGFQKLIAAYKAAAKGRNVQLNPGDVIPLRKAGPSIELKVLAARGKVVGEGSQPLATSCAKHPGKPVDPSDNAQSLALKLRVGRFDFLDCGDLTWNIEHKLVCPKNRIGTIDLFQVTHHGADQSNNPAVIEAIKPICAVIDNGPHKGGAPETYATLKASKSLEGIFQLHKNLDTTDADNAPPDHIANLAENCNGTYLRVRLSADGKSYTIAKGSDAPLQTFKVR